MKKRSAFEAIPITTPLSPIGLEKIILPTEIFTYILILLPPTFLGSHCTTVCKQWNAALDMLLSQKKLPHWAIEEVDLEFLKRINKKEEGWEYKANYKNFKIFAKIFPETSKDDLRNYFEVECLLNNSRFVRFFGVSKLKQFFVYERLPNIISTLAIHHRFQDFTWDNAFGYCIDIVDALNYMHNLNIIHKFLEPKYLMLGSDGRIKVSLAHTRKSINFNYSAPELEVYGQNNTALDVYSFGMILWELVARCLTGFSQSHFINMDNTQVFATIRLGRRPRIFKSTPKILVDLLSDCWASEMNRIGTFDIVRNRLIGVFEEYIKYGEQWNQLLYKNSPSDVYHKDLENYIPF